MPAARAVLVGLLAAVGVNGAASADPFFPAGSDTLLQVLVDFMRVGSFCHAAR